MTGLAVIGIGASTGGPPCIRSLLGTLRGPGMPPVVIVQHLNPAFLHGFGVWLAGALDLNVSLAEHGAVLRPQGVFIAPAGHHLELDAELRVRLCASELLHGRRPAIDRLFESLAPQGGPRAAAGRL